MNSDKKVSELIEALQVEPLITTNRLPLGCKKDPLSVFFLFLCLCVCYLGIVYLFLMNIFFLSLFLLGFRFWRGGGGAGQAVVIISFCATSLSHEEDITSNNETR